MADVITVNWSQIDLIAKQVVSQLEQAPIFQIPTEKKITQAGLNNSSTRLLDSGDIIIYARGTVGVIAALGRQVAFNQSCGEYDQEQAAATTRHCNGQGKRVKARYLSFICVRSYWMP